MARKMPRFSIPRHSMGAARCEGLDLDDATRRAKRPGPAQSSPAQPRWCSHVVRCCRVPLDPSTTTCARRLTCLTKPLYHSTCASNLTRFDTVNLLVGFPSCTRIYASTSFIGALKKDRCKASPRVRFRANLLWFVNCTNIVACPAT
jgi:hypothetical protein